MAHAKHAAAVEEEPREATKLVEWARVFVMAGAVLAAISPFVPWSDGWLDGHNAVWRSVLNDAYALGYDGPFWVVLLAASAVSAVGLALWRLPDRLGGAATNRIGLLSIGLFWLLIYRWSTGESTCFTIGPCDGVGPRLLLAAVPLLVLGTILLPSRRMRGGRMGALAVGVVLALAIGAGIAAMLAPPEPCHGCDDPAPQTSLRNALAAANTFAAENHDSYVGFGPREAAKIDGALEWLGSEQTPTRASQVAVRTADQDTLLLVSRSSEGDFLCILTGSAESPPPGSQRASVGVVFYGSSSSDVAEPGDCSEPGWSSTPNS